MSLIEIYIYIYKYKDYIILPLYTTNHGFGVSVIFFIFELLLCSQGLFDQRYGMLRNIITIYSNCFISVIAKQKF